MSNTDEHDRLKAIYEDIALSRDERTTACDFNLRELEIQTALEYVSDGQQVLDVGCGPHPVHLISCEATSRYGLDSDHECLASLPSDIIGVPGDSRSIPFPDGHFDVVMCHYLLMWTDVDETLTEMIRVTRDGGRVLILSEPDYLSRKESPECLLPHFMDALTTLGAHLDAGSQLTTYLSSIPYTYETNLLRPEPVSMLRELENDALFLSKVLSKDIDVNPLITALSEGKGELEIPIHYACIFKA